MRDIEPYQLGMLVERENLRDRLDKLVNFISSNAFIMVCSEEQQRLRRQMNAMRSYLQVLNERIKAIDA